MSAKRTILFIIAAFAALSRRRAGASGLRARHLGFGTIRERRPRQPHFHGRQPRRQAAGDPRRGDLLRLHGARSRAVPSPRAARRRSPSRTTPRTAPAPSPRSCGSIPTNGRKSPRSPCRAMSRPAKKPRRALPGRCRRGPAAGRDAQRLLLYISGTADAGGDRLRQRFRTARSASRCVRRAQAACSASTPRSESRQASGGEITSPTSSRPTNPAGTLRDALEVAVDGRSNSTTIVAHGIGVDPRPADATQKTPRPNFRKISLNLDR